MGYYSGMYLLLHLGLLSFDSRPFGTIWRGIIFVGKNNYFGGMGYPPPPPVENST
jgi:hypothetical protein